MCGSIDVRDPRFSALQFELKRLNDLLAPDKVSDLSIAELDKGSAFKDAIVRCQGATLVQLSTDGDLSDVTYRLDKKSKWMEAMESPHIAGPVATILVSNAAAEPGRMIRVARYRCSPLIAASIQHGTPKSTYIMGGAKKFYAQKVEYVSSTDNFFESDQPLGTTPTLYMTGSPAVSNIMIHTIKWQFTPTNAVTYQLFLLEDAQAVDEHSESNVLFASDEGMVGGTIYVQVEGGTPPKLPIQISLATEGRIYYLIDWSAAPGDTIGYIKIYGEAYV